MKARSLSPFFLSTPNNGEGFAVSLHLLNFHRCSPLLFILRVCELRSSRKNETRRHVKSPRRVVDSSVRHLNYVNPPVWDNAAVAAATTGKKRFTYRENMRATVNCTTAQTTTTWRRALRRVAVLHRKGEQSSQKIEEIANKGKIERSNGQRKAHEAINISAVSEW